MRGVRNETGYALLLVLLLIVFITILTAVFLRGSISNAKQEQAVDKNHLTVISAETGMDYYKNYFSNIYYDNIPELEVEANRLIEAQKNKGNSSGNSNNGKAVAVDYVLVQKSINDLLLTKMKNGIQKVNGTLDKFGIYQDYTFFPENLKVEKASEGTSVKVTGTVRGTYRNAEIVKRLNFTQEFKTITFDPKNTSELPSQGAGNSVININNLYPGNEPNSPCLESKIKGKKCTAGNNFYIKDIEESTIFFPKGYMNEKQGNVKIDESTIFSNGPFHVKNMNDLEDSHLYINGSFSAKNMNDVEDTLMVVNGKIDIDSNIEFEESQLVVNGDATIKGHLDIEESKVCIAGSLSVGKTLSIDKDSMLYYWNKLTYKSLNGNQKNIAKLKSASEVLEKCKIFNSSDVSKEKWQSPSIDVTYQQSVGGST
ncbi:hypothetical protein ABE021_11340 [Sporosarcina gallistercoris]|uniref:hypothetical protein n=1 Tax=Sporosarcina gallistercoris TaxID=2762245 RepID=UPI003D26BCEE